MKCDFCGGQGGFAVYTKNGKSFCSSECEHRFFTTSDNRKQQKHEEIKRMAEKIYVYTIHFLPREKAFNAAELPHCWELAKRFYEYAKEKEEVPTKTLADCKESTEYVPSSTLSWEKSEDA